MDTAQGKESALAPLPSARRSADDVMTQIVARMESLEQHCLTDLLAGLDAMQNGDLSRVVSRRLGEPA